MVLDPLVGVAEKSTQMLQLEAAFRLSPEMVIDPPEELALELGLTPERVREIYKIAQHPISLQAEVGEGGESQFGDFLEDYNHYNYNGKNQFETSMDFEDDLETLNLLRRLVTFVYKISFKKKDMLRVGHLLNFTIYNIHKKGMMARLCAIW